LAFGVAVSLLSFWWFHYMIWIPTLYFSALNCVLQTFEFSFGLSVNLFFRYPFPFGFYFSLPVCRSGWLCVIFLCSFTIFIRLL